MPFLFCTLDCICLKISSFLSQSFSLWLISLSSNFRLTLRFLVGSCMYPGESSITGCKKTGYLFCLSSNMRRSFMREVSTTYQESSSQERKKENPPKPPSLALWNWCLHGKLKRDVWKMLWHFTNSYNWLLIAQLYLKFKFWLLVI